MPPDSGTSCLADSDCTAGSNGRCDSAFRNIYSCVCSYDTCTTDADCAQLGGPCQCRPEAQTAGQGIAAPMTTATNFCLGGNCRVDADCGPGGYCSPSFGSCGAFGGVVGYYCHTAHDKCIDDADCSIDCRFDPMTNVWACGMSACAG
jgi:hypothetical protein